MVRFISLASGSKGNAYLACGDGANVLIDAGLSARELERRIQLAGLLPSQISLLLLTHEHADHMMSAALLSRRHGWPVAATEGTLRSPCGRLKPVADGTERIQTMPAGKSLTVGRMTIRSFSVSHDAADPVGYVIQSNGFRAAVATDLGEATLDVLARLHGLDLLVLESNHCPKMLAGGRYPAWLKNRIASPVGHLSNQQASDVTRAAAHPGLRHLLLAHLSENNNTPRAAYDNMRATLADLGAAAQLRVCRQNRVGTWIDLNEEQAHDSEVYA